LVELFASKADLRQRLLALPDQRARTAKILWFVSVPAPDASVATSETAELISPLAAGGKVCLLPGVAASAPFKAAFTAVAATAPTFAASSTAAASAPSLPFSEQRDAEVGMRVMLHGLRTSSLNGSLGRIVSLRGDRAGVLIDDCPDGPKSVKIANIFVLDCGPPPPGAYAVDDG
jgi:hypothetical protein